MHAQTHSHTQASARTHTRTQAHTHAHKQEHTHTHTHKPAHTHHKKNKHTSTEKCSETKHLPTHSFRSIFFQLNQRGPRARAFERPLGARARKQQLTRFTWNSDHWCWTSRCDLYCSRSALLQQHGWRSPLPERHAPSKYYPPALSLNHGSWRLPWKKVRGKEKNNNRGEGNE